MALLALAQHLGDGLLVALLDVVAPAQLEGVLAERLRDLVHVALQGEEALRAAVAAEGPGHGQVRVHGAGLEPRRSGRQGGVPGGHDLGTLPTALVQPGLGQGEDARRGDMEATGTDVAALRRALRPCRIASERVEQYASDVLRQRLPGRSRDGLGDQIGGHLVVGPDLPRLTIGFAGQDDLQHRVGVVQPAGQLHREESLIPGFGGVTDGHRDAVPDGHRTPHR